MKSIGLIGDLHGRTPLQTYRGMKMSEPDFCLQVGDYGCYGMSWPVPVYWIEGNHDLCMGAYQSTFATNNFNLKAGLHNIQGIKILALPSQLSPEIAPGPAIINMEDWEECYAVEEPVDIVLSHGCGFPFYCWVSGKYILVEDLMITKLLQKIKPKIAISGHNHFYAKEEQDGIQLIRMGLEDYDLIELEA